jgi:hypothetical protein
MAQRTRTLLIDDLGGGEAAAAIRFVSTSSLVRPSTIKIATVDSGR